MQASSSSSSRADEPVKFSRRPTPTPFNQQKMRAIQFQRHPAIPVGLYFLIGLVFIPLGVYFIDQSKLIVEKQYQYDGPDVSTNCSISSGNEGTSCSITFSFNENVTGPLYLFYELHGFYQNHRRYVKSRSEDQLMGDDLSYDDVSSDCYPLVKNGSSLLNPCGLIANTFFNDDITLNSTTSSIDSSIELDTDGITWSFDSSLKYQQVSGFVYKEVTDTTQSCGAVLGSGDDDTSYDDCESYTDDDGTTYYYWYPNNDSVQYLYETFDVISPIDGVEDEHFINWMRTSGLASFRKLYGKIDTDVTDGDTITFDIIANYEVSSIEVSKYLVLSTLNNVATQGDTQGVIYMVIGCFAIVMGTFSAFEYINKS